MNNMNTRNDVSVGRQIRQFVTGALVVFDILLLFGGYNKDGKMFQWVGKYMVQFMEWIANLLGSINGVGWAIIIISALLRLILLPLMIDQQKKSTIQSVKMQKLQPQILKIQEATKDATTPEERIALQTSLMAIYRENGVSVTDGINFLSLLIQMPVFSGLYSAIRFAPEVQGATFFGINLAQPNIWFAILAAGLYLIQGYLMIGTVPENARQQMRAMMFISPLMTFMISVGTSAALGLYFIVGGIFFIIQSLIILSMRPKLIEQVEREFEVKNVVDDIIDKSKKEAKIVDGIEEDVESAVVEKKKPVARKKAKKKEE